MIPAPTLSLLVLLPASAHVQKFRTPIAPPSRPPTLTSRQSGSSVPSALHLTSVRESEENERMLEEAEMKKVISAGRRMSLAPGIGTGTQTRFASAFPPLTPSRQPIPAAVAQPYETLSSLGAGPSSEQPPPPPAFGAKRGGNKGGPVSKRRPQTAAIEAVPAGVSWGSIALPSGGGFRMGGVGGRTRPGWEGDEVVRILRHSGLEGK